jgi:hypothetical protein
MLASADQVEVPGKAFVAICLDSHGRLDCSGAAGWQTYGPNTSGAHMFLGRGSPRNRTSQKGSPRDVDFIGFLNFGSVAHISRVSGNALLLFPPFLRGSRGGLQNFRRCRPCYGGRAEGSANAIETPLDLPNSC